MSATQTTGIGSLAQKLGRSLSNREFSGLMADIAHDFTGTLAALRALTPEIDERRAAVAEHELHRVELRRTDGTVAARGELISVTVISAYLMFTEAGESRVPLSEVHEVVRLQPVRDLAAVLAERRAKARRDREEQAELDEFEGRIYE